MRLRRTVHALVGLGGPQRCRLHKEVVQPMFACLEHTLLLLRLPLICCTPMSVARGASDISSKPVAAENGFGEGVALKCMTMHSAPQ